MTVCDDRPLVQASVEFLELDLTGADVGLLTASLIEISTAPAGGAFGAWVVVDEYAAPVVKFLVGPGTPLGTLALGPNSFRVRFPLAPEVPVLPAGVIEVVA